MSLSTVMRRSVAASAALFCLLAAASPASAGSGKEPPALTPAPRDALTRALARGNLSEAEYTLERARSLFHLAAVRREFGAVARPDPRAATPILRDLVVRRSALRGEQAQAAAQILARPGANHAECDLTRPLCFHWGNAVAAPNVTATETTFASVFDLEVGDYGYLPPLPDGTRGGNSSTDIYIRDLGNQGLFGYCTTDDPSPTPDVYAYCVVDDDFADFGDSQTPQEFRDVTAAHEFFHAIQFAYDSYEDLWLMEGTAMLMEGQFRPDVEDRVRYLAHSALTFPAVPVDYGAVGSGFEYGAWLYWRFLVEDLGELGNPVVIRNVWEEAAGAHVDTDGPGPDTPESDLYSLQAAGDVLRRRGLSISALFAKFAVVNRDPASFYVEGGTYDYPAAPTSASYSLGPRASTGRRSTRLRHLSSRYYTFTPARNGSRNATLKVSVDLPSLVRRPSAALLVRFTDGSSAVRWIKLGARGNGARTVSFGRGTVRRVVLALTNTSIRMLCDRGTDYSCTGVGRDDLTTYVYRAVVR
jgi:hypothetical protein